MCIIRNDKHNSGLYYIIHVMSQIKKDTVMQEKSYLLMDIYDASIVTYIKTLSDFTTAIIHQDGKEAICPTSQLFSRWDSVDAHDIRVVAMIESESLNREA